MRLGLPTRGPETDKECPECGSEVRRRGEKARESTGLVLEERYECNNKECLHFWWEDAPDGLYRD